MKKVKFYTLGCKVNQYDTQKIREQFLVFGFKEAKKSEGADICIINTCTVTHRADADSLNIIRKAKRDNPYAQIVVTGCLAELDAKRIEDLGAIALVVKNKEKPNLLKLLIKGAVPTKHPKSILAKDFLDRTRAFLKIQDGCNNFCSYCKIPLVRGRSHSRTSSEILLEAKAFAESGFKEIVLTGICLGAYGKDLKPKEDLVGLIRKLETIDGILRIRLSSIEVSDISDRLIKNIASSNKLCTHLHIPIQSGDGEILKKMNRPYNQEDYLAKIKKIKANIPGIAITTDIMVGFPGEKEANFANTLKLVKIMHPLKVHIFPYSPRMGTFAADKFRNEELSVDVVNKRVRVLKELALEASQEYQKKFIGKSIDVLIENKINGSSCSWAGYTSNYLRVKVDSLKDIRNKIVTTKLSKNNLLSFDGGIQK